MADLVMEIWAILAAVVMVGVIWGTALLGRGMWRVWRDKIWARRRERRVLAEMRNVRNWRK